MCVLLLLGRVAEKRPKLIDMFAQILYRPYSVHVYSYLLRKEGIEVSNCNCGLVCFSLQFNELLPYIFGSSIIKYIYV